MASDPLDQLQSMFPTIDGDVIAIVFSESDKDVSSTVEKLLQLVPTNESDTEFPSLQSTVQRSQPRVHSLYQAISPPSHQPDRSSSGPAATGNSTLTGQRGNRRLQGPTHIPPAVDRNQQLKNLTGNEFGGGLRVTPQQRVQQNPYQQSHQSKAYGQTNLGKGTAPGNQRRAGGGTNTAGGHGDNVPLHGHGQQKPPQLQGGFYQLGGTAVNSMPALSAALEPNSYFYHQALQPPQQRGATTTTNNMQQQALHHQYQLPPQSHSHSKFQPQSHSQVQAQAQYRAQQQQQQAQRMGTGNGMYGYSGLRPNDPLLASWMNSSRQSDFPNNTNAKNGQFYPTLQQPGQHQNWPTVMDGGGKTANLQQYHQQQQQNPNPLPYGGSGGYPLQAPVSNSLLGGQSDQSRKSDWSMYSVAPGSSSSGGGGNERGNMDAISALLLQPERAMTSSSSISSSDFGRYGHVQSEPSLSKLQTTNTHHRGHNSGGAAPGNKVDPQGRKTGVNSGSSGAAATQSGKGSGGSEVKGDGGSKKLIILRGLPGSGKTTLARSLIGSSGVICCTDDFFMNNGEYVFDPSLLEENHEKNKSKARDAMKSGRSPVIIDNTNTNAWEMKPYVLLAMEHGYAVEILEPDTPWRFKTSELARRNSHGVPRQSLEKMLERYDHRVTLESIIVSQPPERKPRPTDSEPSRASSGGNGGQSSNTGGQYRERGRTTKMSPTTPRHQHGGGAYETDHTHHSKQQNRSSQLSPRPGRRDQRSNDSSGGGGRVSPRPTNQRGQRSSKDNSGRNGNEQYHHQNHNFGTSSASESGAGHVSVIGEGRPSSSDNRKKTTPTSSNQHQHQTTHQSQTASTASVYSNKSQNDQFSRAKGRRTTAQQQQQQAGSKSTLGTSTAASNKKRSMSPSPRGPGAPSASKQNSQIVGGRENDHRRRENGDRAVGNGHVGQKRSGGRGSAGEGKKNRRGTEEDMDDEFLWDSSEETEILDADEGVGGGGGESDLRNGPVFMTDEPPKNASFRPVPQVGKAMMNGITVSGGIGVKVEEGKRVPIFDVWKDSDDEDIDDSNEGEDESPIPIPVVRKGQGGQQQHTLQRTVEVANVSDKTNVDVFEPPSVGMIQAPPSHPWEKTQSARDLQAVNDHFTSLIRRVQSANPTQPLSTLSESDGSRSVVNSSDETFNVFTMSSVWGSQSGLLGSKIQLYFGEDADSKLRVDRIDSLIKSYSSLQGSDSSESQLEKQKKAQSFYSMLDALAEEKLPAIADKVQSKEIDDGIHEHKIRGVDSFGEEKVGVRSKLLDEAVQGTQSSLTVQEAIEDEAKCPLRNKLIKELLTENISVRGKNKRTLESVIESASDVLETNVDIEILLPEHTLESDLNRSGLPPPVKTDASVADVNGTSLKGAMVSFVADSSFEEGCSVEAFTDKVFIEGKFDPQQNFQAAFQIIAQKAILEQRPSSFAKIDKEREKESFEESTESNFEDPAIVSKVYLAGESDTNLKKLPTNEGNRSARLEKEENKSLPVPSPEQLEPLDVFPSAFDEGLATSFPPSSAAAAPPSETADKSQSTTNSREESSEPISSPLQSQTPVNEPTEPGISDANNIDNSGGGDNDGCGQEDEVTFEPLSAETDKPTDEGISAADSALTLTTTTSEPSLEGYYLDWSAPSVDNLTASSNWESDLLFLVECFPDLEPNYLSTLLKKCKESLEAAISTILVSHSQPPEEQSFMYFESQFSTDTTDDASSTISSASYTSQSHGFGGQQLDSSPEQQATITASQYNKVDPVSGDRQKPIFSIGDESDEKSDVVREPQLVPFFEEPECANDEEIARTLQEELDHAASSSDQQQQSNQEATTSAAGSAASVGDHIAETAVEKRDRSSSHGSEDTHEPRPSAGDENLELRLSASLARQLQDMFGPVTDKLPFEGEIGDDDLVVLLSERAAHEIYKKWLDTLHAKRIGYRVQSEIDMTRDEALARRLQKEEDSKAGRHHHKKHHKFRHLTEPSSLAVMATEKYRAHHNSSPPQLKGTLSSSPQTGGGLTDIMGEQMAQQVQEDEVAQVVKEKSAPNLSLKLQLKNLHSQFPSLEQPLVNQTLVKNKFDISSTVAELEKILLLPPPPPSSQRESIDGCGFSKAAKSPAAKGTRSGVRGSGGTPAKRKLFKNEGREQKHGGKGLPTANEALDEEQRQLLYLELRAEAALHAKLRAESFMKAAHARSKKQYEVAQYYAQQGHLHTEKMKEANQRAAEATLQRNFTSSDQLDLHGLHVNEAITALEEKLGSCKGSKLRVVTGQGIHSKGGKGARIRPAVINYLQEKKYKIIYDEKNPGVLNVKLE